MTRVPSDALYLGRDRRSYEYLIRATMALWTRVTLKDFPSTANIQNIQYEYLNDLLCSIQQHVRFKILLLLSLLRQPQ